MISSIGDIDPKKVVIVRAKAKIPVGELVEKARKVAGRWHALQLFSVDAVMSREHLLWAYANALNAEKEKLEIAATLSLEVLLFAAMSKQISDSIAKAGAKEGQDIVVFAENTKIFSLIAMYLEDIKPFDCTPSQSEKAAHSFGLPGYNLDSLKAAMALSRL